MNLELKELCQKFIETKLDLKKGMRFANTDIYTPCTMMYINKNKEINKNRIELSKKILNNRVNAFSYFRGMVHVPVVTMLSISDNPVKQIEKTTDFYNKFKKYFFKNNYVALCSLMFCDVIEESRYDEVFSKTKNIYNKFKKEHRFITDAADLVMCLVLANTNLSEEEIVLKSEEYYKILKEEFFSSNSVQTLSHILTLQDGNVNDVSNKFLNIYKMLKENGFKYSTSIELGCLGLLSLTDIDIKQLLHDFKDVDDFLKEQKGYNTLFLSSKQRYLHVTMLLLNHYKFTCCNISDALLTNISLQYIIAQQIMMASTTAVIVSTM